MQYSVTNFLFLKLFWLPETDRKPLPIKLTIVLLNWIKHPIRLTIILLNWIKHPIKLTIILLNWIKHPIRLTIILLNWIKHPIKLTIIQLNWIKHPIKLTIIQLNWINHHLKLTIILLNWIKHPIKLTIILIELNLCVRFTTSVVESYCKPDMKDKSIIIHFIYLWLHIYWNNQIGYRPDMWRTKKKSSFLYIFLATYLLKQPNWL